MSSLCCAMQTFRLVAERVNEVVYELDAGCGRCDHAAVMTSDASGILLLTPDSNFCFPPFLQVYEDFVPLLLDLQHLARGELFVGTFSLNIRRLIRVMREASKRRMERTMSVVIPLWNLNRRELVVET